MFKRAIKKLRIMAFSFKRIVDYRNYNIRPKLISILIIFSILAVGTIIFVFFSLKNIQIANKNKSLIILITKYAQDIIYNERDYLKSPLPYRLTKYSQGINNLTVTFDELKKYYSKKDDIEFILRLINDHMKSFFSIAESIEDSKNKGYSKETLRLLIEDAKNTLSEKDKDFFSNLLRFNKKFNSSIDSYLKNTYRNICILFIVIFTLFFILAVFIFREINISIILPIKKLDESMLKFGSGDLDSRADIVVKNEIGSLAATFNKMVASVKENIQMKKFISQSTLSMIKNSVEKKAGRNDNKTLKKKVTIFFSDMRGFTSMSEKNTSDKVIEILNLYLNFQAKIIHKNGGDIDKFVGDEIVAVFAGENMADKAVKAAMEIQLKIAEINRNRITIGRTVSEFGIGINTGEVIFGSIGSHYRKDFTIIGDNVNLASRLCSAAGSNEIIISKSVKALLSADKRIIALEPISVKGKIDRIEIFKIDYYSN